MSYSNSIIQAYLQFQGDGWLMYDRALCTQAASRRTTDWTSADSGLYAWLVACRSRWSTLYQFCFSSTHKSQFALEVWITQAQKTPYCKRDWGRPSPPRTSTMTTCKFVSLGMQEPANVQIYHFWNFCSACEIGGHCSDCRRPPYKELGRRMFPHKRYSPAPNRWCPKPLGPREAFFCICV